MQVNYIDFDSDLYTQVVSEKPALYVSDNQRTGDLQLLKKEYRRYKRPLMRKSKFYSWQKFKEIVFPCEKITIREEKQSVALFEVLTEEEKEILGIDNYNDIIDFSARFHDFYLELKEYQIQELPPLEGWQKERLDLIKEIRARYIKYLQQKGLTDPGLVRDENNFTSENLRDFEKLILLNPINLTPLEKNILYKLDSDIDIELYLQLSPSDFSEKDLEFKGLSLPPTWPGQLSLYTAEEDMLQLASAFFLSQPGKSIFLSPRLDETEYERIISADKLEMPREQKFSHTPLYKFIRSLYRLLQSSPPDTRDIGLPELLQAAASFNFRSYFEISLNTLDQIREMIQDNYIYLTPEAAAATIPELKVLFKELDQLRDISNLSELINYMDDLNINKLKDSRLQNDLEQFYDSLMELSALEDMDLVSNWDNYYENTGSGLLDRLLQYLEYKRVEPVLPEEEPELKLKSLYSAPQKSREHLLVLNARQGWLMEKEGDFLLTESQRKEVGLPVSRDSRRQQRYYFLRHLLTAERAEILSLKNKEENESPGAFMEELKLKYELDFKKAPVDRSHYIDLYQNIFEKKDANGGNYLLEKEDFSENIEEKDPLIEKEDFPGDNFYLSYYKYVTLDQCYFRFFCEKLMNLEREMGVVEKKLEPLTFGNIVHSFAEVMLKDMKVEELELSQQNINELMEETLKKFHPKIDHRFRRYYEQVVREELIESMQYFLDGLKNRLQDYKLKPKNLKIEYTPRGVREKPFYTSALVDYYLSGRIDLFIESEPGDMIIDFKSGGMKEAQLNFYALLLQRLGQEKEKPVYKSMYQVMERQFLDLDPGTENDFRNKLKEAVEEFAGSDRFIKNLSSECSRCPYKNICRVVKNL